MKERMNKIMIALVTFMILTVVSYQSGFANTGQSNFSQEDRDELSNMSMKTTRQIEVLVEIHVSFGDSDSSPLTSHRFVINA